MREFDAFLTLMDSAQVFHFKKIEDAYCACVSGRVLTDQDADEFAAHYFDDQRDYCSLYENAPDENAKNACSRLTGLRVLNQPAWEALVAFIMSANNNVKRITLSVNLLNEKYGIPVSCRGETIYGFPEPKTLASADTDEIQKEIRCGYRAKYLVDTAKMISDGFPLEDLKHASYEDARKCLMRLPGVGPKVSDCVCLFGLGHAGAFPVDVWVKRLMKSWFHVDGNNEFVRKEARRILGEECGIYQQSLFHAARTGLIRIEE